MKSIGCGLILLALSSGVKAQNVIDFFERFEWQNRLLLVFAPDADDPRLRRQDEILGAVGAGLADRDMRIIHLRPGAPVTVDGIAFATPAAADIYRDFDIDTSEFAVLLIGKDGTVKMKNNEPPAISAVFDLIDSMPMRQLEMQQKHNHVN